MNKKNLIIILIIVLLIAALVAGGVFFFLIKDKNTNDEKEKTSQVSEKKDNEDNKKNSNSTNKENTSLKEFDSADDLLEEFFDAYENEDSKKLATYVNISELKEFANKVGMKDILKDIDKDELVNIYKYLFDEFDIKYKPDDITKIENSDDITKKIGSSMYEDEEEYEKQLGDYIVYAVAMEMDDETGYDLILIKENKRKYSLAATRLLTAAAGEIQTNSTEVNNDNDDDNTTSKSLSQLEIESFNALFTNYEGTQRGSMVKSLLESIVMSNQEYSDEELITIKYIAGDNDTLEDLTITPESSSDIQDLRTGISAGHSYQVSCGKNKNGRVNTITIEY